MEIEVGEVHEGKHHEVHKRDLEDGTESRVARGTVSVVLGPVSHTDDGGDTVNDQHAGTDPVGFPGKPQGVEERVVDQQKDETGRADDAAAEVDEPFRSLESCLVISGPDFLSDENGGRIGKAAEEGNDQTLHGTEDRHGGDGLFGLASQHDVDQHVSHTDEHLIADDGEAFFKILGNSGAGPAEMLGKFQYIGNLFIKNKADQNQKVYDACENGSHSGAGSAHLRQSAFSKDEKIVEKAVCHDGGDAAVERNPHLFDGAEQGAHGHGQDLERIGEADNPEIGNTDSLDLRLVRVDAHDKLRRTDGESREDEADRHHEEQSHAVGTGDALVILCSPVLSKEEHAAADEAPVAGKHEA